MDIQKNYYAVIPAAVRYDKTICSSAKLLYGEVSALCNQTGECWAGNEYFAKLYDKDERTIIRWINSLIEAGYLQKNHTYDDTGRKITGRKLRLATAYFQGKIYGADVAESMTKMSKQHDNFVGEHDKNVADSMTKISVQHDIFAPHNNTGNNTVNITKVSKKEEREKNNSTLCVGARESYEEIINSCKFSEFIKSKIWEFVRHCQLNKDILTNDRLKGILGKLKYQVFSDTKRAEVIYRAIDGGWTNIKLDEPSPLLEDKLDSIVEKEKN